MIMSLVDVYEDLEDYPEIEIEDEPEDIDPPEIGPPIPPPDPELERQADEYLKQCRSAIDPEYPAYTEPRFAFRKLRRPPEFALEQVTDHARVKMLVPPEAVARMMRRALKASCTDRQSRCWVLTEAGFTQEETARILGLTRSTVAMDLMDARKKLRNHIDTNGCWVLAYKEDLNRMVRPRYVAKRPLRHDVAEAMAFLEESQGWQVMICDEDCFYNVQLRIRIVYNPNEGFHDRRRHDILSVPQLLRLCRTGEARTSGGDTIKLGTRQVV